MGEDRVHLRALRTMRREVVSLLTGFFNVVWWYAMIPTSWRTSVITAIPKKRNAVEPTDYRPIAVAPSLYRAFLSVINLRLLTYFEGKGYGSTTPWNTVCQYGFRPDRSAPEAVAGIVQSIQTAWACGYHHCFVLSADISKAYDRCSRALIRSRVRQFLGVRGEHLAKIIDATLTDTYIKMPDLEAVEVNSGVAQGAPTSPQLYSLCVCDLPQWLQQFERVSDRVHVRIQIGETLNHYSAEALAAFDRLVEDDPATQYLGLPIPVPFPSAGQNRTFDQYRPVVHTVVVMYADDTQILAKSPAELEFILTLMADYFESRGMRLNPAKSQYLRVTLKSPQDMGRKPTTLEYTRSDRGVCLAGQVIPRVDTLKVLGMVLNSDLTWGDHVSMVANKVNRNWAQLQRVIHHVRSFQLRKQLVVGNVFAPVEFGLELYGPSIFRMRKDVRNTLWRQTHDPGSEPVPDSLRDQLLAFYLCHGAHGTAEQNSRAGNTRSRLLYYLLKAISGVLCGPLDGSQRSRLGHWSLRNVVRKLCTATRDSHWNASHSRELGLGQELRGLSWESSEVVYTSMGWMQLSYRTLMKSSRLACSMLRKFWYPHTPAWTTNSGPAAVSSGFMWSLDKSMRNVSRICPFIRRENWTSTSRTSTSRLTFMDRVAGGSPVSVLKTLLQLLQTHTEVPSPAFNIVLEPGDEYILKGLDRQGAYDRSIPSCDIADTIACLLDPDAPNCTPLSLEFLEGWTKSARDSGERPLRDAVHALWQSIQSQRIRNMTGLSHLPAAEECGCDIPESVLKFVGYHNYAAASKWTTNPVLRADARRHKELTWIYSIYCPSPCDFLINPPPRTSTYHCNRRVCNVPTGKVCDTVRCCLCNNGDCHVFPHLALYCGITEVIRQELKDDLSRWLHPRKTNDDSWVYRIIVGFFDADLRRGDCSTSSWYCDNILRSLCADHQIRLRPTQSFSELSLVTQRRVLRVLGKRVLRAADRFIRQIHMLRLACAVQDN